MSEHDRIKDVSVTVEFHLRSMFTDQDLGEMGLTLEQAVRKSIDLDGLCGLVDGGVPGPDAHVIEIKEWIS